MCSGTRITDTMQARASTPTGWPLPFVTVPSAMSTSSARTICKTKAQVGSDCQATVVLFFPWERAAAEVRAVYAELINRPVERTCLARTGCCQFQLTGRTPHLTKGEALV